MPKVTIKFVGSEEYEIFDLPAGQTDITTAWLDSQLTEGRSRAHIETVSMEGVTQISYGAFYGCTSLASIVIPNSVIENGGQEFSGFTSLEKVTIIPASVTSVGDSAFYGCRRLTEVTIPASVTSIGGGAFWGCTSLTEVIIPASVTSIGPRAFSGFTSLTFVIIQEGVHEICEGAFKGCTSLERIIVHTAAQQQMLLDSNSGIAEGKIIVLSELLTEDHKEKYRITYSEFSNLNSKEQDLYLEALYEYRAQSENSASTDASGGESKEADTSQGSVTTIPKEFLNILREKYNDAVNFKDPRFEDTSEKEVSKVTCGNIIASIRYLKNRKGEGKYAGINRILRGKEYSPLKDVFLTSGSSDEGTGRKDHLGSEADNQGPQMGGGGEEKGGSPGTAPVGKGTGFSTGLG